MAAAVTRQEGDQLAVELADHVDVRGIAERRLDAALLADRHPLHPVQAAATDHTDADVAHQKLSFKRNLEGWTGSWSRQSLAGPGSHRIASTT